jgi:hypothetical protein
MIGIFPESVFTQSELAVDSMINENQAVKLLNSQMLEYDYNTYYHSCGVARLMVALVVRSDYGGNVDKNTLKDLAIAGQMHDIGKQHVVCEEILNLRGQRLNDNQWSTIKAHPIAGFVTNKIMFPDRPLVANLALNHHSLQNNNYPATSLIEHISIPTKDQVREVQDFAQVAIAIADQCEARIPLPKLNSHPYNDRSGYSSSQMIGWIGKEVCKSPNNNIKKKK